MPACNEFDSLIISQLAGNLTLPESRRLTEHLGGCRRCGDEIKSLEATIAALAMPEAGDEELKALEEVPARTLALWRRSERRRPFIRTTAVLSAAAAAVLIFFSIAPRQNPLQNYAAQAHAPKLIDLDLDEPLSIAEPLSAALIDSEMGWSGFGDLPRENEMALDELGADL